jgi:hypothetical protein
MLWLERDINEVAEHCAAMEAMAAAEAQVEAGSLEVWWKGRYPGTYTLARRDRAAINSTNNALRRCLDRRR